LISLKTLVLAVTVTIFSQGCFAGNDLEFQIVSQKQSLHKGDIASKTITKISDNSYIVKLMFSEEGQEKFKGLMLGKKDVYLNLVVNNQIVNSPFVPSEMSSIPYLSIAAKNIDEANRIVDALD